VAINRTARIARTAHDKTHINRLAIPEFGVVEIQIKGQSNSKSKSYRDGSSTTPVAPSGTGADAFHFAPGPQYAVATWTADPSLKDDVQIVYKLHNPQFAIEEAKIEIFTRFSKDPVWTRALKDDELLHGEHTLQFNAQDNWDGKIDPHVDFPGQFLTVEHSPYKMKLTVKGEGVATSPAAWTYFHVMIAKVELEYGPKDVLPATVVGQADHRKVYDDVVAQGAKPPSGATVKVPLESNIFKKGHSMFDNSFFTEYETMWTTGPLIPLFLKVWVKNSAHVDVVAPKALGKVKFLWDWESKLTAPGVTFVDQAQDYEKSTTKPKGENCHKKRGGKRGPKTDAVFPARAGYAPAAALTPATFPFEVEVCPKPRTWASYSYVWDDGLLGSKTGVMFQPSRMAGDAYKISVYVAYDRTRKGDVVLNVAADAPLKVPAVLMATTDTFQVWREIHLVKYEKKTAGVTDLTVATVQGLYRPAFVELKDNSGGSVTVTAGTWNGDFTGALAALSATNQDLVDATVDQHAAGDHGCDFLDLPAWIAAIAARTGATVAAVTASLTASGITTAADHADHCNSAGQQIVSGLFNTHLHASEGANIFHFDGLHNHTAAATSTLRGWALDLGNGTDRKCGFLQVAKATDYSGPPNDIREFTCSHEFGHHFFLPHTPDAGEKKNYKAHDKAVTDCLMSYNFGAPRKFCGFCQLRLRGWSKAALSPSGAKNKK
jgi:hypothetical protein